LEIVLLLLVVVGWLIVRGIDRDEIRARLSHQDDELSRLRDQIAFLNGALASRPPAETQAPPPEKAPEEVTIRPASYKPPAASPAHAMAEHLAQTAPPPPPPIEEAPTPEPVEPPPPLVVLPSTVPESVFHEPPPPPPTPVFTMAAEPDRPSLEQRLGTNWLNRIGVALLVFGIAFGLAYEVTHVGPVGKILMAYAVSLVLLVGGLWLERKPQYRIFARAGIGGGWALGFLTTYAMYFFPATQVLTSQAVDLVLLFLVGVGMVVHSLRYRSQVVTGLAFLLAFSTVTISQVSAFSLLASAVLALGLEFVCVREEWYGLEIAGIVAAYGNHFIWLDKLLDQYGGPGHPFPLWGQSTALLLLFWAIFRAGYCIRKPKDAAAEGMSGLVAVLNSIGILTLMKYQSFHPEYAFRALLALGAVEMTLAFVMRRRRRPAFAVLAIIASVLLIAAIPFRFHGVTWPLLWVLEGEALFICGVVLRERLMRSLGLLTHLLVVAQMLLMHGEIVFTTRPADWVSIAVTFFVAAAAMWLNAEWLSRRDPEPDADGFSPYTAVLMLSSFAAALSAVYGFWILIPGWTLVLVWALLALVLVEVGLRSRSLALRIEGYFILLASLVRLAAVNLTTHGTRGFDDIRLWAGLGLMTACVLLHLRLRATEGVQEVESKGIAEFATWCASALAMGLLYIEIPEPWLAVAWAVLALILLEAGIRERSMSPRLQSYGALLGALIWLVAVNFQSDSQAAWTDPRLWAGAGVIAACLLFYERLSHATDATIRERTFIGAAVMWCASALVSSLLYMELPEKWLAAGWAAFALVLACAALVRDGARIRSKSLILAAMVVARALAVNLSPILLAGSTTIWPNGWGRPAFFTAVGLLAAAVPIGFLLRRKPLAEDQRSHWMGAILHHPEQVFFFAVFALMVAWVPADFHKGNLTMGWSALGLAFFLAALAAGERSFRLAGLGLLLVGVAKLLVVDVWGLPMTEQILLFVSVGIVLILVSFLYSRFGDRLKEYL
jgi:uncharacterized membrane protein